MWNEKERGEKMPGKARVPTYQFQSALSHFIFLNLSFVSTQDGMIIMLKEECGKNEIKQWIEIVL
jgi:hypothetical protein